MDSSSLRLKFTPLALAACMALPISAQAEDEAMIEEVVVTGSYIARAVEEQSNPVDVYDRSEWEEQGPQMVEIIRPLQQCRER